MYCNQCGTENLDEALFCASCGAPLRQVSEAPEKESTEENKLITEADEEKKALYISKKAFYAGIAVLTALGIAFLVYLNAARRVDASDYFISDQELVYEGYDGYGYFNYPEQDSNMGFVEIQSLYLDLFEDPENSLGYLDTLYGNLYIDWYINDEQMSLENGILKNGDEIIVRMAPDYDYINSIPGIKKKLSGNSTITKSYVVNGLKEPFELDPFSQFSKVYYLEDEDDPNNPDVLVHTDSFEEVMSDGEDAITCRKMYDDNWTSWEVLRNDEAVGSYYIYVDSFDSSLKTVTFCTEDEGNFLEEGIKFSSNTATYDAHQLTYIRDANVFRKEDAESFKRYLSKYLDADQGTYEIVEWYFKMPNDITKYNKNFLEVVVKTNDTISPYQSFFIRNLLQDDEGMVFWEYSDYYYSRNYSFSTVEEYQDYYSFHEGDTIVAHNLNSVMM